MINLSSRVADADHLLPAVRHVLARRDGTEDDAAPRRKFGLVVQGGSMRGVFTAGALCAMRELGLRDHFDLAYGSSGGAVNTAYFLSDQVALGTSVYYCDLNNNQFISWNPARILRGTALDIDYCFDEVIGNRKQLDLKRTLEHPTLFKIYVTDPAISRSHCFLQHGIESEAELFSILKASAAMPLVFRKPVRIRGRAYVDGAFLEPLPVLDAMADGCTDVIALLSRPMQVHPVGIKSWARKLIHRHIRPDNMAASEAAWRVGQDKLESVLGLLDAGEPVVNGHSTVHLAYIAPPSPFPVHRWTTQREQLVAAAVDGAARVLDLFGVGRDELRPEDTVRADEFL
jgi:predicted patatin/cPLA2 family phospholipase